MDPVYQFPASPGTPLFPVSPERANRKPLPQSPSMPSISHHHENPFLAAHARTGSDVQGKVAQFNNLTKEAAQRRKDNEAALKRALVGREEAESEVRRLREDNRVLRQDMEEGRGRERKVATRIEGVMEELQRAKETHAHSQTVYEKEVRRARKEAFKSSSALVKMQEELKSARNKYTLMREEVDVQKRKLDAREQERFAAQYQLVGVQEELDNLRQQMKVAEEERDALKTSLKEEEVARIAAEGAIALPTPKEDDEFASPTKSTRKHARESLESMKENIDPEEPDVVQEIAVLKEDLRMEKRMRSKADDQVHFMKMECQFQCCSCRTAEKRGVSFVGDNSLEREMAHITASIPTKKAEIPEPIVQEGPTVEETMPDAPTNDPEPPTPTGAFPLDGQTTQQLISFSPTVGNFNIVPSPMQPRLPRSERALVELSRPTTPITNTPQTETDQASYFPPMTPRPLPEPPSTRPIPPRTISATTTTRVPLKDDFVFSPEPNTPGRISREEALEQIRLRRGRARSIAAGHGTPRRPMTQMEGFTPRREISAPGVRGLGGL